MPVAIRSILCSTLLIALTGCIDQSVNFNSNPEGAKVRINGEIIGRTPISKRMPRKAFGDTMNVQFELEGYKTFTRTYTQEWDKEGAFIGCAISLIAILPCIFHLPWCYSYESPIYVELEPQVMNSLPVGNE